MTDLLNYARLLLYPALIYGIFLITTKSTRRTAVFTVAALWLSALEVNLLCKLIGWDLASTLLVNFVITPLLAVFVWAVWWTIWKERKRV